MASILALDHRTNSSLIAPQVGLGVIFASIPAFTSRRPPMLIDLPISLAMFQDVFNAPDGQALAESSCDGSTSLPVSHGSGCFTFSIW